MPGRCAGSLQGLRRRGDCPERVRSSCSAVKCCMYDMGQWTEAVRLWACLYAESELCAQLCLCLTVPRLPGRFVDWEGPRLVAPGALRPDGAACAADACHQPLTGAWCAC